jgi:hypothetical protein
MPHEAMLLQSLADCAYSRRIDSELFKSNP